MFGPGDDIDAGHQLALPNAKILVLHQEQLVTFQEQRDMSIQTAAYETRPPASVPLAAGFGSMGPPPTSAPHAITSYDIVAAVFGSVSPSATTTASPPSLVTASFPTLALPFPAMLPVQPPC